MRDVKLYDRSHCTESTYASTAVDNEKISLQHGEMREITVN